MDHANPEAVRQSIRKMVSVFIALLVLTVVTVAASYLHVAFALTVFIALVIAVIKGSLVAGFFMHLSDEKKIIYWILILCVIFFAALMALPSLQDANAIGMGG